MRAAAEALFDYSVGSFPERSSGLLFLDTPFRSEIRGLDLQGFLAGFSLHAAARLAGSLDQQFRVDSY